MNILLKDNKIDLEYLYNIGYKIKKKEDFEFWIFHEDKTFPEMEVEINGKINYKYWYNEKKEYHRESDKPAIINYLYEDNKLIGTASSWYINNINKRKDNSKPSHIIIKKNTTELHWTDKMGNLHRKSKPAIERYENNKLISYSWYIHGVKERKEYYYPAVYNKNKSFYYKDGYNITTKLIKFCKENEINLNHLNKNDINLINLNFGCGGRI